MVDQVSVPLHTLPAVFAHERHKPHRSDLHLLELVTATGEQVQGLLFLVTEGNKNTSTFRQLLVVRRRHLRSARAYENCIIRRVLPPAQSSVSQQERDVACADFSNGRARSVEKRRNSLV